MPQNLSDRGIKVKFYPHKILTAIHQAIIFIFMFGSLGFGEIMLVVLIYFFLFDAQEIAQMVQQILKLFRIVRNRTFSLHRSFMASLYADDSPPANSAIRPSEIPENKSGIQSSD